MEGVEFVLGHISDLHFSEGTDLSSPSHSHSMEHLVGLEKAITRIPNIDYLVVSGDISNTGSKQSLINASGYIFDTIPIGSGKYTGLKLPPEKCGIVPGNHDAWNAEKTGSLPLIKRRQISLDHYNFAFNNHKIPPEDGCYYRWLESDGEGIFVAFVDSCFLGDTEENTDSTFGTIRFDQAIAKGKLSVDQSEKLLEWHDLGIKGHLQKTVSSDDFIERDVFAKSLKVIIMHHYLFEPPGHSSDYFMRVKHRDVVFRNVAMSDFDIMLCGHKHIPSFDVHTYGHHFDDKAINRYLINYFRRIIGLHSLPIQFEDDKGKRWARALTFLSNILTKKKIKENPNASPEQIADGVLDLLKNGLEKPDDLEKNVKSFIANHGMSGADLIEGNELREIRKRISVGLSLKERSSLREVANKINGISRTLASKPFLQVMSGSTVKATTQSEKSRYFNAYSFVRERNGWKMIAKRYQWNHALKEFDMDNPFITEHFVSKRI